MCPVSNAARLAENVVEFDPGRSRLGDALAARAGQHKKIYHVRSRQLLYFQGAPATSVFCVRSGKVKLFKTGPGGRQYILRIAGPGDVLGLEAALTDAQMDSTAEMIEGGAICRLDLTTVLEILHHDGELTLRALEDMSTRLRGADDERLELAQAAVRERMARLLATLAASHGVPDATGVRIDLSLSREEMAEMIGTAQETAIRQLSEFKQDRLIQLHGRSITVLDLHRLEKAANMLA